MPPNQPRFFLRLLRCTCPARRRVIALDRVVGGEVIDSVLLTFECCGVLEEIRSKKATKWPVELGQLEKALVSLKRMGDVPPPIGRNVSGEQS